MLTICLPHPLKPNDIEQQADPEQEEHQHDLKPGNGMNLQIGNDMQEIEDGVEHRNGEMGSAKSETIGKDGADDRNAGQEEKAQH